MADGRMLKKKISQSRRLATLKTDTARMFYTWLLSHLDIEGRFSADPDILKGAIVPRLKHITPQKIDEIISDMAINDLITLYFYDGDKYLQYRAFEDNQILRKDREKASEIPEPNDNSRITPGVLQDNDGSTPAQVKLREVKISKDICSSLFVKFYEKYPLKKAKMKAQEAFEKINPDEVLLEKMLKAIERQRWNQEDVKNRGAFVPEWPYPATWLNGKRWEDEEYKIEEKVEDNIEDNIDTRTQEEKDRDWEKLRSLAGKIGRGLKK